MTVTLLEVWRAARARSVPFAAESAGHLTLAACEEILVAPRRVGLSSIELLADGLVRVRGPEACGAPEAEAELRALLGLLIEVASSPGAALVRAAGRPATGNLTGLSSELEKALIPVNRAAARRALVRLYRETERAVAAGRLAPAPEAPPIAAAPPPPVAPPSSRALSPALPARELSPPIVPALEVTRVPVIDVAPAIELSPPIEPVLELSPPIEPVLELSPVLASLSVAPRIPAARAPVLDLAPELELSPPPTGIELSPPLTGIELSPSEEIVELPDDAVVELEASALPPAVTAVSGEPPREREPLTRPETVVARRQSQAPAAVLGWVDAELALGMAPGVSPSLAEPVAAFDESTERAPWVEELAEPDAELAQEAPPEVAELLHEAPAEAAELLHEAPAEAAEPDVHLAHAAPPELELAEPDAELWHEAPAELELAELVSEAVSDLGVEPYGADEPLAIDGSDLSFELVADGAEIDLEPASIETGWLAPLLPVESYPGLPPQKSDVRELLVGFEVAAQVNETELRRELKVLAGVDLTPGPPADLALRSRLSR